MSLAATTRLALALTALAAAALPAGASAATVDYTAAGRLAFAAAPGEANAITIAYDDVADPAHPVIVRDALLALTTSQPGCVAGATPNEVRCAATDPDPEFDLGDGDDTFDVDASVPVGPLTFRVNGGDGADRLTGGPRADVLVGGAGIDTLTGGRGDDILDARGADDAGGETLDGSAGNDTLIAGAGADTLNGNAGNDVVEYADRTNGVTVDLRRSSGQGETGENDTFISVEGARGGDGDDTLIGDDAINLLAGGLGNDVLRGLGGDDILDAKDADAVFDLADCGDGNDAAALAVEDQAFNCETVDAPLPELPSIDDFPIYDDPSLYDFGSDFTDFSGDQSGFTEDAVPPQLKFSSARKLTVARNGSFALKLLQPSENATATLQILRGKTLVLQRAFRPRAGRDVTLHLRLPAKTRKLLTRQKRLSLRATISLSDDAGNSAEIVRTLQLSRR